MDGHLWLILPLVLLGFRLQGGGCLRDVSLTVNPPAVLRGHHATLHCLYDLEGADLYAAKFYRGRLEFYRYSPGYTPAFKVFPHHGINVDLSGTNETQVQLRDVGLNLSGNFSCEVTALDQMFTTIAVYSRLLVVELPSGPPQILTGQQAYLPGDTLSANCSSPPSHPAASLHFFLNDIQVGSSDVQHIKVADSLLYSSVLSLTMQLFPSHFIQGQVILKCSGDVSTIYSNSSQMVLTGVSQRGDIISNLDNSPLSNAGIATKD